MSLLTGLSLLPSRLSGPVRRGRGLLVIAGGDAGQTALFAKSVSSFAALADAGEPVTILLDKDAAALSFLFPPGLQTEFCDWKRFRRSLRYRLLICTRMRRRNFRLVVCTSPDRHPLADDVLVAACQTDAWAGEAHPLPRFAREQQAGRRLFSRLIPADPVPVHDLIRWTHLAEQLSGRTLTLPSLAPAAGPPARQPDMRRTIMIHPFTTDSRRELAPAQMMKLIAELPADCRLLISGTSSELNRHSLWQPVLQSGRVNADTRPLQEKFTALHQISALITVDHVMTHLGTLAGTPTFSLCSAAFCGHTLPYPPGLCPPSTRFYHAPCDHAGCRGECHYPLRDGAFVCLPWNSLQDVTEDVLRILSR